jgi:hypothetical protein
MSDPVNANKLNGKMKILYSKYPLTTHKFRKLYYTSNHYKNLIDYLYGVIPNEPLHREYKAVIPALELMTSSAFEMLCQLEKINKLDSFVNLIKMAAK